MPQHTLADAFLSQFPSGANPIVDILKGFTGMMDAETEKRKQQATTQQPAQPPPPSAGIQAPQPEIIKPQIPQQPQGQSGISDILRRLLIPGGAAIAGSVNPNILPQAAGLSTGFTNELIRQEEQQAKSEIASERKSESKRKEEKRDRKDIREKAERAVDKTKQFFPVPALREAVVKRIEEEMLEAAGLDPGKAAVKARKQIERSALQRFASEEEARKAGKKSGDRVNIGGVDGRLD